MRKIVKGISLKMDQEKKKAEVILLLGDLFLNMCNILSHGGSHSWQHQANYHKQLSPRVVNFLFNIHEAIPHELGTVLPGSPPPLPPPHRYKTDIDILEKVQCGATNMIKILHCLSCEKKLRHLGLFGMEARMLTGISTMPVNT